MTATFLIICGVGAHPGMYTSTLIRSPIGRYASCAGWFCWPPRENRVMLP